jgi:hypothetical protein
MNAVSNECVGVEVDTEVTSEMDAELVEVGAVSETKGGIFGAFGDTGNGWQRF